MSFLFDPVFSGTFTLSSYLVCTAVSLLSGFMAAGAAAFKNRCSKGFLLSLILLPAIVQTVIMMVNGNLGAGVAVMGAFSLVRFRSVPGSAREIVMIFLCMTAGLATAMGYVGIALLFVLIICLTMVALSVFGFSASGHGERELRITVPESLNYIDAFDDLFRAYAHRHELIQVKTTAMGSLLKLTYRLELKDPSRQQDFLNELRCRNGNLEIALGFSPSAHKEEL